MAKILYGLCTVGMGHAVRSKVILEHLMKKHDVLIATSGKSLEYLKKFFPNKVVDVEGFELAFKNNAVRNWKTVAVNFKKISSETVRKLKEWNEKVKEFKPTIVVSDWEPFSSIYAKNERLPLISIDNQHYIIFGDYKFPKKFFLDYIRARIILQSLMRKSNYYLITLLPENKLKKIKTKFGVNPIIRPEVVSLKSKVKKGSYVLVYQSTKSYEKLVDILKHVNQKFVVYGYDKKGTEKNLTFKKFTSGNEFTNDLAGCKAVIANGGFTLISEALYLRKPLLVVPIKKHFEQIVNALYIQKNKYGEFFEDLDVNAVIKFLSNLNKYRKPKFKFDNNKKLFDLLDKIIENKIGRD